MGKIAYFSNTDFSLLNFRRGLMREVKREGYKVYACSAVTNKNYKRELEEEFNFVEFPLKRRIDLWGRDILYLIRVYRFCKKEKIKICHNFTIKPCIYATIAQRLAKVETIYCTITGAGYTFEKEGLLKKFVSFLYKISLCHAKKVIFQNPEDKDMFVNLNIIEKEKTVLIKSSGVNTKYFSLENSNKEIEENIKKEINYSEEKLVITFISRMLWRKGVKEFVEAADILREKYDNLEFLLVGPIDMGNPSAILKEEIDSWVERGLVKYLKKRDCVREILAISNIFVLPSFYREGVPRSLLEAGSMGLPLITTNAPGCREVVEDGVNGFLVEPRDGGDVADKIDDLIEIMTKGKKFSIKYDDTDKEEIKTAFGKASREKIKREFSEEKVIKETLKVYGFPETGADAPPLSGVAF